ncbi:hypothetical protein HanPI659440_Chr16g0654791 [Helianthus annuus]|nr:hypothetical protein HanPI659440_Chr16g0654791 [Helianthus annuus]
MAKTNKYTSLNFNDIYDKKTTTNNRQRSSSSSSISSNKTLISNSRIHGNMLVLTRPSPKPIAPPSQPSPPPPSAVPPPDRLPIQSDSISLRPLGHTGSPSPSTLPLPSLSDLAVSVSPKTNKFVPPHLRPGFHGREEKPEPEVQKQTGFVTRSSFRQGLVNQVEERRPKSGGGYEAMNRPRSSGSNRPFSSG